MFTHLHTHSEYSLLDGLSKIPDLVRHARALGQDAVAVTDHGAMYGAIELYETARAHDIKPIIGLETYVAPGSRTNRDPNNRSPFHLTLLAQNETGYRNLIKLSSAAHLEGFYYRPRVDRELLEQHNEGLIVLSGCPSGEVMGALGDGRDEDALQAAAWYRDVFAGRYYVELQEHGQEQFSRLTPGLVDLARSLELPLVLTNDSHYTFAEQQHAHDVLLCIGTNSTIQDPNRFSLDGDSFYLKSEEEMRALLPELPEAADNTALIAEQVDIKLEFGQAMLPDPGVPAGTTPARYLRQLCDEGVRRHYGELAADQRERLEYELSVIEETGFVEYMLIVRDVALFAREQRIPMGVRGSAAASMVLYCLGVIDIEPTQYNLVFERFLNPERISMPDVDFDFADDRRDEVIRYAAERFGRDHVAQIITFGTLGAKAAIRDSGRALGLSYGDADRVARLIPDSLGITIDGALEQASELSDAYEREEPVRNLVDTARGLEGVSRHASTHAAGVVITRESLTDVLPLQRPIKARGGDDEAEESAESLPTTQYAMTEVEKIGLLKLDFLGLTNLTILGHTVDLIREQRGMEIDLARLPDGDEAAAALFAAADTFGIFQMESTGMRRYVAELQPADIREIAAMVALYRPGPMEHISTYIDAKHGRTAPAYPHPDLAEILDETYGVLVYQDQVLQIAKRFAGYSLGQADVMRKAMGKKIADVMLAERDSFVSGAVGQGYDRRLAEQLFVLIEPFAGYGFNKAHAFSYGVLAYQTAYLKAHYPVEFMTAVLVASGGNQDRIASAATECARLRIAVLPPDVNASAARFTIEQAGPTGSEWDDARDPEPEPGSEGGATRFGLAQIKNVGAGAIDGLTAEREENGPFLSLEDFARRINPHDLNRRALESLAKAGALDSLDPDAGRSTIAGGVERILSLAQQEQRLRETGQTSMFDMFGSEQDTPLPALELKRLDGPKEEILAWERELLGTYISEHPFKDAHDSLEQYVTAQAAELTAKLAGSQEVVAGTVITVRSLTTKQGKPFAAVTIEDLSGSCELTVWPDTHEQHGSLLMQGATLLALVDVRERGDRLTIAVQSLAAYDGESRAPIDYDPARFEPRKSRAKRPPRPQGERPGGSNPGPPAGGNGSARQQPERPNERAQLRAVDASPPPGPANLAASVAESPASYGGLHRLQITMEETTDASSDVRRLKRIVQRLHAYPGEVPVELLVQTRGGRVERLSLDIATAGGQMVNEISALLGVLGTATEVGELPADITALTAGPDGLAAVSGG
ncbi:MAG: DNA polymerase III subunit alpha [Dehalococcoidia bacterium]|jgi:DNA polymerase-3 subunit alpha|nr:DNA polymerase III subunit alpha [Dehalococcoidia bacterium]